MLQEIYYCCYNADKYGGKLGMMCSAYFGELCDARKKKWENDETNPYGVLSSPILLERKGHKLLDVGSKYFHERIQIDWGSFAWKCTSEEILRFLEDYKETLPWLVESDQQMLEEVKKYISERKNTEYGVVFVEEA